MCSQHGSLPGLPPFSTSTSQIVQRRPPESRGILRASGTGGLLKPVPVFTPETSGLPPKTSSRGGQSQALAEVESKEDSVLYRLRSARLITGTTLHANERVQRHKSPVEKESSEQEDPRCSPNRDCPRSVGAAAGSADTLGLRPQVPEKEQQESGW